MSIKSILFFAVIFVILLFMYFNNEYLSNIQNVIRFLFVIAGIGAIFFYPIVKNYHGNYDYNSFKKYLVKNYKKNENENKN